MDCSEQENRELREEVTTLRESFEGLSTMMGTMAATQNQPHLPSQTSFKRIVISEIISTPISV